KIPKLSTPLAKGIRTTEGILTYVVGGLITIVSGIDPQALPHKEAANLAVVLTVLYTIQRGLLKVVAIQKGFGVAAPIDDQKLEHTMAAMVDQASQVDQIVNEHGALLEKLNKFIDGSAPIGSDEVKNLLKEALSEALKEETSGLPGASAPTSSPTPESSSDPVADAAAGLTDKEEETVQPSGEDVASAYPPPAQIADGSAATPD